MPVEQFIRFHRIFDINDSTGIQYSSFSRTYDIPAWSWGTFYNTGESDKTAMKLIP